MNPSPSNPVLSQIPKAQESYVATLAKWEEEGVDTSATLLMASKGIAYGTSIGAMAISIPNIENHRVAEKAALELEGLGYNVIVTAGANIPTNDGSGGMRASHALVIQWKAMPANTRDKFTM